MPNIYVLVVFGLWLCEDITACCYMYCYFRNMTMKSFIGEEEDFKFYSKFYREPMQRS